MDDQFGGLITRIRANPASPAAVELLNAVIAETNPDLPKMTSVDAPRLRALAVCMDTVAQHQQGHLRERAKAQAAAADEFADLLERLGRAARAGFGQ